MEIKIFDYDESLNPDSKMKLMSLVTRLKN